MSNVSKRVINWFFYNFIFGFSPLIASVAIYYLVGKPLKEALITSPEILFFVIMTTATGLGNLSENDPARAMGWDIWIMIIRVLFLCGAIGSTFLYTILLYNRTVSPELIEIPIRLIGLSVPMAIFFFFLGIITEFLIGKAEESQIP